jgi:hypothetical protein
MANEIRVLVIEDKYPDYDRIVQELERRFEGCDVLLIRSESEFIIRFDEIMSFSPHFAVVDLFLKWCEPEQVSSRPQLSETHPRHAGQRIVRCLCNEPLSKSASILVVSALGRDTVRAEFGTVPENVYFPDRKSPSEIANAIFSLTPASLNLTLSREGQAVPQRVAPVPFSEALEAYRSRVEGRRRALVRPKLFISYCHEDRQDLEMVKRAIRQASRADPIDVWEDALLTSGEWKPQIEKHMSAATAALFLVTMDFCASDFIQDTELKYFLEAYRRRGTKIMWIAVGASSVKKTQRIDFQCLNKPERPLRKLDKGTRETVLVEIAEKIAFELR